MVTQKNPSRTYGPRFAAHIEERAAVLAAESRARSEEQAALRASVDVGEKTNSVRVDRGLDLELVEDWEIERLENLAISTQAASSMSSYKAQKCQNPAENPEVAMLLERYGDIRGVMTDHPLFRRIQKPLDEGGWGTGLAGLIWLAKEFGLERVLWAARQAKDYQGARDRGAVFNHAVRNGLEVSR